MPIHIERHFRSSDAMRDAVLGISDGLTTPFALAAGLTGAVVGNRIIVTAGLAEIAAGSIAMSLGGYLAARSEAEHYQSERAREKAEIRDKPLEELREVVEVLQRYGLSDDEAARVADGLRARPEAWIDFMMRFELGLEKPDPQRAVRSAVTIGGAYAAGGLVPLFPYFIAETPEPALLASIAVTCVALAIFGYVKGRYTGAPPLRSAFQTTLIGGAAASAAFLIARLVT